MGSCPKLSHWITFLRSSIDICWFRWDETGHFRWALGSFILDKISKIGVFTVAHRRLQRDGLLGHFQNGSDALDRQLHLISNFIGAGFTPKILQQPLLDAH